MRPIDEETRLTMNSRRNFVNYATMTLSDGTVLNLTPSDFRISGNNFTDDLIDGEAFQIGTAIGKTATMLLDNTDGRIETIGSSEVVYPHGKFSEYDFYMAYFILYECLPDAYHYGGELRDQMIPIGTFTVTTPTSHGTTIEIVGVDNMYLFDRDFDRCDLDFSTNPSLKTVLNKCCTDCGVAIGYGDFDNQNLTVSKKPEGMTYRQIVSFIAQIAGCNAKINVTGALTLMSYDMSALLGLDGGSFNTDTTPYSDGDTADGGTFNPWNTGDNFDGGNFTTPLGYHNLTSISGTSIGTDDIRITGVSVSTEDVSVHYPNIADWDYYALEVKDNPFVEDHESTIAESLFNKLAGLLFRPFTTSSIQDPTIEAGDPCIVYDVKGNQYYSFITNVVFKTGGMTDLSCKAEPPARQGARYSTPASVTRVANEMTSYQTQQAHFNEIAEAALGYFKTQIADTDTGATITYLHDQATLESSQNVVKIANGIVAISDNYNTTRTWNSGLDISTGTLLLNLVYVHGLTSDWINTGILNVGGLNNIDGVIHVTNRANWDGNSATMGSSDTRVGFPVGPSQITRSGTYKIFYALSSFESGKPHVMQCQIQKRDQWSGSAYTWKVIQDYYPLPATSGELPITFDVDTTNGDMYYWVYFNRVATTNAAFTAKLQYNKINTIIDKSGIETSALHVTGGSISIGTNSDNQTVFNVSSSGACTARSLAIRGGSISIGTNSDNQTVFSVTSAGKCTTRDLEVTAGTIKLNGKTSLNHNHAGVYIGSDGIGLGTTSNSKSKFYVDSSGSFHAIDGDIAGYTIDMNDGFKYSSDSNFCQYSRYMLHIGGLWGSTSSGYWTFFGVANKGEFAHLDYGRSNVGGLWITKNGQNDIWDFSGNTMKVTADNIDSSVNGQPLWTGSDRKLKQNIEDLTIEEAEDLIYNAQPRKFEFKHNPDKKRYGFVAQELKEILPENSGIEYVDEDMDICCVQYIDFIAPLCAIVKAQQKEIDDLKSRLKALENIVNNQ